MFYTLTLPPTLFIRGESQIFKDVRLRHCLIVLLLIAFQRLCHPQHSVVVIADIV